MLVNLYTRQNDKSLIELKEKGRIANKKIYIEKHMMDIADYFTGKYDCFVEMAEDILPRPEGVEYPIWCSVSKDNCLKSLEGSVVYCLQVPRDQVIYFSSEKWDMVLNDLYIPLDDEDEEHFDDKIKRLGVEDKFNFIEGRYAGFFPNIEKEIMDSWDRIFIIDEWNEYAVQANLWEIKEEWIQYVINPDEDIFEIATDMSDDLETHKKAYYKK